MKFFRAGVHGASRVGVMDAPERGAVLLPERFSDVVDVIEGFAGTRDLAAAALSAGGTSRVRLEDCRLLSPVGRFRRDLLCTGWNYWDHFEEGRGKRND